MNLILGLNAFHPACFLALRQGHFKLKLALETPFAENHRSQ